MGKASGDQSRIAYAQKIRREIPPTCDKELKYVDQLAGADVKGEFEGDDSQKKNLVTRGVSHGGAFKFKVSQMTTRQELSERDEGTPHTRRGYRAS